MPRALYILIQCTWGLLQTLAGLAVFLRERRQPRFWYHGAVVTRWRSPGASVSLGMFVFVSDALEEPDARPTLVHEYGHTLQSLLLGPLYLLVIGLPSLTWGFHPHFVRRRREERLPYTAFFTERWASRWGEKATGEKAI